MGTIDIKDMNVQDRLLAMETLWNSLLNEELDLDSPEWHQDILNKRKSNIQNGKAESISLKDLKDSYQS
jgi:Putative addiction module component